MLTDQQGDYVYVVGGDDKAQQRRIQLGQSTPADAPSSLSGLTEGETVILDGIQRVRPGQPVSPGAGRAAPGAGSGAPRRPAPRALVARLRLAPP